MTIAPGLPTCSQPHTELQDAISQICAIDRHHEARTPRALPFNDVADPKPPSHSIERKAKLLCCLQKSTPIAVDEADDDGWLSPRDILRQVQAHCPGRQQHKLLQEVWRIYYAENEFFVQCSCLPCFTRPSGFTGYATTYVKKITVTIDLFREDEKAAAQQNLQSLKALSDPDKVLILLRGGGAIDGSDLETELVIKNIAQVIKDLICKFECRFDIQKVQGRAGPARSLLSYWKVPCELARQRFKNGQSSIEDVMRVQVDKWTSKS